MNKYFFILILLLVAGSVSAQKKASKLIVKKSENGKYFEKNDLTIVYQAVFQQDNTILSSDSAYFHQKANTCEAFGHVVITQGDTMHVYGDKLHYDGNTKIAIMTDNVRMVDKDATLTTNYLTYNTATKYATYTGGGKLINKDNTLTSKNGYYFSSSRDAYFRYNVILNTTDAIIKTDTLRYNSGSRIAFFYGPTNIYGKKDKDTLYTENGTYNTQTEQAFFGKNNLYKQNTKSLKGDSLFYDRLAGYGKALRHVTFMDTEQKIILKGGLGEYFKKTERTLMTIHPYVVFVTEENDTTKADSAKHDSIIVGGIKSAKPKQVTMTPPKNSMPVVDSAQLKVAKQQAQKIISSNPDLKNQVVAKLTSEAAKMPVSIPLPKNSKPFADTTLVKMGKNAVGKSPGIPPLAVPKKDTSHIKRDSIFMTADTIETEIMVNKEVKATRLARLLAGLRDTTLKEIPSIIYTKPVKHIDEIPLRMSPDTTIFHKTIFVKKLVRDTSKHNAAAKPAVKKPGRPAIRKVLGIDSVNISQTVELNDTVRVRILIAAHHAKIFKSDLQAKADSIFFSYSDSVARMYYKPIIWAQGSQLSADTVNLQLKRKQMDNIELYPHAFIVNIENNDSTHFNQVGGKKMRGFFKNGKLDKMFVFANAETIYFNRDSLKVTQMHRTISSKIRVNFKKNEPIVVTEYAKTEAKYVGIDKLKDDDKVLRGFIWKPKERPVSKESIINPPKPVVAKKPDIKGKKPPLKDGEKAGSDSLKTKSDTLQRIKLKTDTTKIKPHEQAKQ